LFMDRLEQLLSQNRRRASKMGIILIDLDGFKLVNETLGHEMGDELLKQSADRLSECVRAGDTVARLGGDEFIILMSELVDSNHAASLGQRVLDVVAEPFLLGDHEAYVSASLGITVYPDDGVKTTQLLRNADAAMYKAKERGKANFRFYTTDMNKNAQERLVLKNGLTKALGRGEFELLYQPKLDLAEDRVTGVEALMRWKSPDLGRVSPEQFIPILEETGHVVEVGEWAIRTACEQHLAWRKAGLPPVRVAVNLSARQLRELDFVDMFRNIMQETGIGPDGLEVEITESMIMSDAENSVIAIKALHDAGIHVAMDDFGTGYSSLSYLKRFPIDTIKIDRSFVNDIATNPDDAEIIRTIISMGRTLNRKIVAEGVESEDQLKLLKEYRCDQIQGYYLSRPLPAHELQMFMMDRQAGQAGA